MKHKKKQSVCRISVFPLHAAQRDGLWAALNLLPYVHCPDNVKVDYLEITKTVQYLERFDDNPEVVGIELSDREVHLSTTALRYACLYLDGIHKDFDYPVSSVVERELKLHDPIIRNLKNLFEKAVSELSL